MDPNHPKTARDEALEAARASKPPDTSAADRQQVVDNALRLAGELSGEIDEPASDDTPLQPELGEVGDLLPEAGAGQTPVGMDSAGGESSPLNPDVSVNPFVAEALAIARAEGREPGMPASAAAAALAAKASDRPGPRLQPPMFRLDVMGAAHAAAAVQSGARRPEIQKLMADVPASSTLPLLDADGGFPRNTQAMLRALLLWEAAAAEAVGDPLFTPKPTTKPRNELASIDRGGLFQTVWMDQATRQPVLYSGPDEYDTRSYGSNAGLVATEALKSPTIGGKSRELQGQEADPRTELRAMRAETVPPSPQSPGAAAPPQSKRTTSVGLPLALPVSLRGAESLIPKAIQASSLRITSELDQLTDHKIDKLMRDLYTEERRINPY